MYPPRVFCALALKPFDDVLSSKLTFSGCLDVGSFGSEELGSEERAVKESNCSDGRLRGKFSAILSRFDTTLTTMHWALSYANFIEGVEN